jgi:hypothetical protein
LRIGRPVRVPVDVVECFLLGQGPSLLPGANPAAETANVIARLSEKSPEWSHVEVNRLLGSWCGGYVTIRGTFCEPLNVDVVNRLNAALAAAVGGGV